MLIKGDRCPVGPLQLHTFPEGKRKCIHCGGIKFCLCDKENECDFHKRGGYTTAKDEVKV